MSVEINTKAESPLTTLRGLLAPTVTFSDTAWNAAAPLFRYRAIAAGQHIISARSVVTDVTFVIHGLARYYYIDSRGREFNKSFSRDGQALSSVYSLVTGEPSPFFVQAMEPCECAAIEYADLLLLGETHREWEILARRMLESLAIRKERREADFLLLSATERYRKFLIEFADIVDRIPNYHVASFLGITEVALSRIRKRMKLTRVNASG